MTAVALPALPGVPATSVQGDSAGTGSEGSGDAFAGLVGDRAGTDAAAPAVRGSAPSAGDEVADPDTPAPAVEGQVLTAAQIIAAAQVVPIAPLLAAAAAVAAAARTEATGIGATTAPTQVAEPVNGGEQLLPLPAEGDAKIAPAAVEGTTPEGAPDLTGFTATVAGTAAPEDHAAGARQESAPAPVTSSATLNSSVQAPAPTTAPAAADGAPHTSGVTGQVFPEISRLVSRGDGTQRITLKLTPEALGDVRVVLTVRGGEVHVRMAGGELAQQALLQGAPELHRLLESVGATASRLEIGESRSSFTDGQQSRSFDLAHEQGTTDHRTARTRDGEDTMATDGATGTVRTQSHGSTDNATRTRTGVDVTM